MRIWIYFKAAIIFLILATLALQGSLSKDASAELNNETVKIQDIVQNEPAYDGKYVVIEGNIDTECPMGCWFIVDDGTAQLYIDIKPNNFIIPQKRGSDAKVYGKVSNKNGDPQIIGKIVEIDGEIYR